MVPYYILYCYLCNINTSIIKQTEMDNIKKSSISKSRSYTACLSEAHRMLFDNFRVIFSRTWVYAAAVAVMWAVFASLVTHALLYGLNTGISIAADAALLLTVAASVVFFARVMHLVNGRPMKWNIARSAALAACFIGLIVVVAAVCTAIFYGYVVNSQPVYPVDLRPLATVTTVSSVVFVLIMLPYVYASIKYLTEPESKLGDILTKAYVTGLRHWGFIFTAMLLAVLCVLVVSLFVSIPMHIVTTANAYSVFGVNFIGDPTGLPSYFPFIECSVFVLTFFIWAYLDIFIIFVSYFLYGSIATKEKEKRAFLKNEKQTA